MAPDADNELEAARSGDRDAILRVLAQHDRALRTVLATEVPSRWQDLLSIDDAAQLTYHDVLANPASLPEARGALPGWLITAGRNNVRDVIKALERDMRGGGSRPASTDADGFALLEQIACAGPSPTRAVRHAEALALLRAAVQRLPEPYRSIIRRYDLDGASIHAVAAELGRTTGYVYGMRARGLERLRDDLPDRAQIFPSSL